MITKENTDISETVRVSWVNAHGFGVKIQRGMRHNSNRIPHLESDNQLLMLSIFIILSTNGSISNR